MINLQLIVQAATNTGIGMDNSIARMIYPRLNMQMVINIGIGTDNVIVGMICLRSNAQIVEKNGLYMVNLLNKTKIESYFFILVITWILYMLN
jgi:hypothetical protein